MVKDGSHLCYMDETTYNTWMHKTHTWGGPYDPI